MVQTEKKRTIILQPTCLQFSRLSVKEPKQNVVPLALPPPPPQPSVKPRDFLMLFPKKICNVGKEKDCGAMTLSS